MIRRLRPLIGLALVGYGILVVLRVMAHDALIAGVASLILGTILLAMGIPSLDVRRGSLVAGLGAAAVVGVLGYNLIAHSGLILPEWGLLLYGTALLVAAPLLDRKVGKVQVGTLVGWSFPLLLAPLLMFALNALLSGPAAGRAGGAADPIIGYLLVGPMAAGLTLFGTPAEVVANNVIIETPRGSLALGIGLVCAGLYPMVLFLGVLGLHAWRENLSGPRVAAYLGLGFVGLWFANLLRLIMLAKIGERWGGEALQTAHAHLGWILFALFMAVFWVIVLRRLEAPRPLPVAPERPPT